VPASIRAQHREAVLDQKLRVAEHAQPGVAHAVQQDHCRTVGLLRSEQPGIQRHAVTCGHSRWLPPRPGQASQSRGLRGVGPRPLPDVNRILGTEHRSANRSDRHARNNSRGEPSDSPHTDTDAQSAPIVQAVPFAHICRELSTGCIFPRAVNSDIAEWRFACIPTAGR